MKRQMTQLEMDIAGLGARCMLLVGETPENVERLDDWYQVACVLLGVVTHRIRCGVCCQLMPRATA